MDQIRVDMTIILIYMSLRKVRKKRIVNMISDEEENAKEALFQISYFEEETLPDQSQVLIPQRNDQSYPIVKLKNRESKKRQFLNKKSKSLSTRNNQTLGAQDYSGNMDMNRDNRKIAFNTLQDNNTIFNAIESNQVFVGNKIHFHSARPQLEDNTTILAKKKRVETMPAIKQKSDRQLPTKDYSSINRFHINLENPLSNKLRVDKWKVGGLLKNERESYLKLKNKLKRELLVGLQERLSRKYQFIH